VGRAGPKAGGVLHVLLAAANKRHAQRVHPVPHHAEEGGEQGERRQHRDQNHRDGAGGQTAEDEVGDQQHPHQGQHHGHSRKEHRPVGRGARGGDRIELLVTSGALLPVAGHDEQGVVDAHRQAHHGQHVGDKEREVEHQAKQRHQPEGDHDRGDAKHERDDGGDQRAQHQDEDDQGEDDPHGLTLPQVALGDGVGVLVRGGLAGHQHAELVRVPRVQRHPQEPVDVVGRVVQ
jgi:hypothetical protein